MALSSQNRSNRWSSSFVVHKVQKAQLPFLKLRWEMFRSRNLEGEMLPPTRATLMPHITRTNYIAMRDKSYVPTCPILPPIDQSGWSEENGIYLPVRSLTLPAPQAVLELTKCRCRGGCRGAIVARMGFHALHFANAMEVSVLMPSRMTDRSTEKLMMMMRMSFNPVDTWMSTFCRCSACAWNVLFFLVETFCFWLMFCLKCDTTSQWHLCAL